MKSKGWPAPGTEQRLQNTRPTEDSPTMQEEKIVLPKFTVPGQRNWTKWALVGVGGLIAVNLIVFGLVLMNRSGTKPAAVGPVHAEVPAATPAAPARAPSAAAAVATSAPAGATTAEGAPAKAANKASARRSRHGHGNRALAKASSGRTKSSAAGGKSDPIDELLKRAFK
jgi:hypothetical protein